MALGSNLMFCYQFMFQYQVPVLTLKIMSIFQMGYINVLLAHTVAPWCLVRCIFTLLGTGQFLTPLPSGKLPLPSTPGNSGTLRYIGVNKNGFSSVCSLYESPSHCQSNIWSIFTYACMISSPASVYAYFSSYIPTGHPESSYSKDAARGGGLESNYNNYIPPQWHNIPSHRTIRCLPIWIPVQKK